MRIKKLRQISLAILACYSRLVRLCTSRSVLCVNEGTGTHNTLTVCDRLSTPEINTHVLLAPPGGIAIRRVCLLVGWLVSCFARCQNLPIHNLKQIYLYITFKKSFPTSQQIQTVRVSAKINLLGRDKTVQHDRVRYAQYTPPTPTGRNSFVASASAV